MKSRVRRGRREMRDRRERREGGGRTEYGGWGERGRGERRCREKEAAGEFFWETGLFFRRFARPYENSSGGGGVGGCLVGPFRPHKTPTPPMDWV